MTRAPKRLASKGANTARISTAKAKAKAAPTFVVLTPPNWGPNSQPVAISLDGLPTVQPVKNLRAAKAKAKAKKAPKPRAQKKRMRPAWTIAAWIGAATCVVLAALKLGDPERGSWLLGYLVIAGVCVVIAAHAPIGRMLRGWLGPPAKKKRVTSRTSRVRARSARPRP